MENQAIEKQERVLEIKAHNGFYGDGNSHYWVQKNELNLDTMMLKLYKTGTYGGQLAENLPDDTKYVEGTDEVIEVDETRPFVAATEKVEEYIYNRFKKVRALFEKYPHRDTLTLYNWDHVNFNKGMGQAIEKCEGTDVYQNTYGVEYFVLKNKGLLITIEYKQKTAQIKYKEEAI